ncbi:MAG: hypothetical protein AB8F34_06270 [Akkermansiaceae bacterium]
MKHRPDHKHSISLMAEDHRVGIHTEPFQVQLETHVYLIGTSQRVIAMGRENPHPASGSASAKLMLVSMPKVTAARKECQPKPTTTYYNVSRKPKQTPQRRGPAPPRRQQLK